MPRIEPFLRPVEKKDLAVGSQTDLLGFETEQLNSLPTQSIMQSIDSQGSDKKTPFHELRYHPKLNTAIPD